MDWDGLELLAVAKIAPHARENLVAKHREDQHASLLILRL